MRYICTMHPEIATDAPGDCPLCGMNLEAQEGPTEENFDTDKMSLRFCVGIALILPLFLLRIGESFFSWDPHQQHLANNLPWIEWLIATPIVFWCGYPFFQKAYASVVNRRLNMFSLIALGIGVAYIYSSAAMLMSTFMMDNAGNIKKIPTYFEAAAMITLFVLLGQILEIKAKGKTSRAIAALLERGAKMAHSLVDDVEKDIAVADVTIGDRLRVKPGETVPVDGIVIEGSSYIDESMISGEPIPIKKIPQSWVVGGTLNQSGAFLMEARRVGTDTLLAKIIKLVSEAQRSKAPIQNLADQISAYFVPTVIAIAIVTAIIWGWIGPEPKISHALLNGVAVLIIACPCALGLATPMSIIVGIGKGAEEGILIKNGTTLQSLEQAEIIAFDKTGTLTEGNPRVVAILPSAEFSEEDLLRLSASVEIHSEHPFASAILKAAKEKNLTIISANNFQSIVGQGVVGTLEEGDIRLGQRDFLEINGIKGIAEFSPHAIEWQEKGQSIVFVAVKDRVAGIIAIADTIKPSTRRAIDHLRKMKIKMIMLTGDDYSTANAIGKDLKIDDIKAKLSPEEKHAAVQDLRKKNARVVVVGDGINDAPALAAANVGIAMGSGTDIAIESADVTLLKGDLMGVVQAILLSHATMRNIKQNLFFAFIYNIAGIAIAAGILYPCCGILFNPIIASAAMAFSSVSVILNALRLKYTL